ncbi:unnamed protein product, partial [Effrenium voratum]
MPMGHWNGFHCYIDELADRQPHALAAVDPTGAWSYAELRGAARRVAQRLVAWGLEAGSARPVALTLPRGRLWYAVCYACWHLGVPVAAIDEMPDKAAEAARQQRLASELRPALEVTPAHAARLQQAIDEETEAAPGPCSPDSVLLYTYTGGTTKHSKCVVVTHAMALWEMQHYPSIMQGHITATDRVLQFTSAYWGAAAFGQIDIALAFGAAVVFAEPQGLAAAIERHKISVLGLVPSLLRATYPGGPGTKAASLRVVLTWGEPLPVQLSQAWKEACFMVDLLIASEYWLALYSHCDLCRDPFDGREKHLLKPLPSLQLKLLSDGHVVPLAPGAEGEMLIAGATVSPGYVHPDGRIGPSEDSEHVVAGVRYLRSRDKLRCVPGGLVYCGRTGSLVKRGGQFVDLEALSAEVGALPNVKACALLAESRMEAFLALEEPRPSLTEIHKILGPSARLHLRNELPRHSITGKVDRWKLKEYLDSALWREVTETQRLETVRREMLRAYCSWYPFALLQVCLPTLLLCGAYFWPFWALPLRLLLLPYLWAALAYTPLLPMSVKRTRAFYETWMSPPDFLLLLAGLLPCSWLGAAQVLACALLAHHRRNEVGLAFLAVLPGMALGSSCLQLALCAGCILVDVLRYHGDRYVLLGLPFCFFLVLPKWLSDEVQWLFDHGDWRKRLGCVRPRVPWDASWAWEDNGRSYEVLDSCGAVRVAKANEGLALTVEFDDVPEPSPHTSDARDTPAAAADGATEVGPLAGLVRRSGGSNALRLDSLQATVLAELIRTELQRSVSVADVLRSDSVEDLSAKLGEAELPELGPELPDESGAYRVFMLRFPQHPVDWCLRSPEPLDPAALQRAVDRLVARHSALQTRETPDEPLRETMDKAAALWQLWCSFFGEGPFWRHLSELGGRALFALWPRTVFAQDPRVEVRVPPLEHGRVRDPRWDWASHD